ncbi:hypothetical protein NDU88_002142 [Pleurodeles waltl]|uniref:Uncharacterized protein n=1 Tax=Pleurodeles waltl TaxID=8319 RepID=A0AAV7MRX2_PLEWA|nr:hypothetical protein NDU88_002142 [Pleurodeles waltl]
MRSGRREVGPAGQQRARRVGGTAAAEKVQVGSYKREGVLSRAEEIPEEQCLENYRVQVTVPSSAPGQSRPPGGPPGARSLHRATTRPPLQHQHLPEGLKSAGSAQVVPEEESRDIMCERLSEARAPRPYLSGVPE